MATATWIALASLTLAGLGFVIGLFKYFTKQINDLRIEKEVKLAEAIRQGDEKRARIYERLDSVKQTHKEEMEKLRNELGEHFVGVRVCELLRNPINQTIADIKTILADIEKKLDKLIVDNAAKQ